MNVLLDGRYIQDHFPGIGRYVYNMIDALARVSPTDQLRVLWNPALRNTRFDIASLAQHPQVMVVRVGARTFSPGEQFLGWDRAAISDLALWHSAYYVMPYFLPVPAVVTLEDVTPLVLLKEMPSPTKRMLYRALNLLAARRAAHIITLSDAARRDIQRVLGVSPNRITAVPLAADPCFRPLTATEQSAARDSLGLPKQYALYLGSNKPHKNLERLVEAWSRAGADFPLIISGHWDPRYPAAKSLAERMGLDGKVRFLHDVPAGDLPRLVASAAFFVFPSVHEGFGLPPLEAMACGTPVACSDASSLPEIVGDAALLFDPLDVEAMAAALARLIHEPALAADLGERGLRQAARFSWERTATETRAVYQRVIESEKN